MLRLTPTQSGRLPLRPASLNRQHPLVKCLDHLWLPDALQPIDKISGLINTGGGSSRLLGADGFGRVMFGATSGGTFTIPAKDNYPLVIVVLGTMNVNNGWGLAEFQGSGSYVLVQTNSSGFFNVQFRRAFGAAQTLTSAAAIPVGTPICAIIQVFSATDYRVYVNGELLTGTTSFAGAGAWLSSAGSFASNINGRVNLIGIGSGKSAISDALALRITRNPQAELPKLFRAIPPAFRPSAGGLTITATVGDAQFAGAAATVDRQLAVAGLVGDTQYAGATARVDLGLSVFGLVGDTQYAGALAPVDLGQLVTGTVGDAQFEGQTAGVTLGGQLTISATVGDAQFDGSLATLTFGETITATEGAALFEGLQATVTLSSGTNVPLGNLGPSYGNFWKKPAKIQRLRRRLAVALEQSAETPPLPAALPDSPVALRAAITKVRQAASDAQELTALRRAVALAEEQAQKRRVRRRRQQEHLLLL